MSSHLSISDSSLSVKTKCMNYKEEANKIALSRKRSENKDNVKRVSIALIISILAVLALYLMSIETQLMLIK